MGRYALNVLDPKNWVEVEGGRAYRSPPDEAGHLERLGARHAGSLRESEMNARIHLAIDGSEHATAATARDAVQYASANLPDNTDTDSLKSRSTRLITTAMLVARDGEDHLLDAHDNWVREVVRRALAEENDRHSGSNEMLRFNRPALGTLALLHLWRRRGLKADRDALISIAARRDPAGLPAFAAALPMIAVKDPRLLKAAMRAAFAGLVWRRRSYNEDEAVQTRFEEKRDANVKAAVAAEVAWLDGAEEPAWPAFLDEKPIFRTSHRSLVPRGKEAELKEEMAEEDPTEAQLSMSIAGPRRVGFGLLNQPDGKPFKWGGELVEAYSGWSGRINGAGQASETEVDRSPSEWNAQFYALFAEALMEAAPDQFDVLVEQVIALPDEPFGDVAETVLHAADVLYFNDASRSPERPVDLRARIATRTTALRRWRYNYSGRPLDRLRHRRRRRENPPRHPRPVPWHAQLPRSICRRRLDPLLEPMRPLQVGGPTSFVAFCTMNMLLVASRARHLDFVLVAVEAWFERLPMDPGLWVTMGILGRSSNGSRLPLSRTPAFWGLPIRKGAHIDHVLGHLVSVGIAEAHELEKQVQGVAATVSQDLA